MPIKVSVDSIDKDTFQKILDYYNNNKSEDEELLEHLQRAEGGFQIRIPSKQSLICDENEKIRQLRWNKKYLLPGFYIGFTEKQEFLLYESLVNALGGNVILEK
jgi:hypothetical protein